MLGKQWLIYYDRTGDVDPLQTGKRGRLLDTELRGRERYNKFRGLQRWHLRTILEVILPLLLQLAVIVFFAGLIDLGRTMEPLMAWITLGIFAVGTLWNASSIAAAFWDKDCPFQSAISAIIFPITMVVLKRLRKGVRWCYRALRRWIKALKDSPLPYFKSKSGGSEMVAPSTLPEEERVGLLIDVVGNEEHDRETPSTIDIEMASWILATATNPESLRSAATSLPLLYVPSILTINHVDPMALSRLQFLLRNSLEAFNTADAVAQHGVPDAVIFSRALFHILISSYIQSHTHTRVVSWWRSYLVILESAVEGDKKSSELDDLLAHYSFTKLLVKRSPMDHYFRSSDPQDIPMQIVGLIIGRVSFPEVFSDEELWLLVLDRFHNHPLSKSSSPQTDVVQGSWQAINVVALALGAVLPGSTFTVAQRSHLLVSSWDAATSDERIWENITMSMQAYPSQSRRLSTRQGVQKMYSYIIRLILSLTEKTIVTFETPMLVLGSQCFDTAIEVARQVLATDMKEPMAKQDMEEQYNIIRLALDAAGRLYVDEDITSLWDMIALESRDETILEILLHFLSEFVHRHDIYITLPATSQHPRLLDILAAAATRENKRTHLPALRLLANAVSEFASLPSQEQHPEFLQRLWGAGLPNVLAAQGRAAHGERSPFKLIVMQIVRDLRRSSPWQKWSPELQKAFYRAATEASANQNSTELAVKVWYLCQPHDGPGGGQLQDAHVQPEPEIHMDWMSDEMIQAITGYLVTPSDDDDGETYPAVVAYRDALSMLRGAETDNAVINGFNAAFSRWENGSQGDHVQNGSVVAFRDVSSDLKT
ncbi:hypothetical protein FRB99_001198 [Tulasnella sp. 403]|nr:hypothetical protein FRB99_001198 [Tulasnella sp. 403]